MSLERSLSALHPRYRDTEERLERCLRAEGLPLEVFETKRSPLRQRTLYTRGRRYDKDKDDWIVSDPSRVVTGTANWSAHLFGLAVDRVLVMDGPFWLAGPPLHPWDTGVERDAKGNQRIVRPQVFDVWRRFGRMANSLGVKWGGQFQKRDEDWHLIGWDPFHTQAKNWRQIAISMRGEAPNR